MNSQKLYHISKRYMVNKTFFDVYNDYSNFIDNINIAQETKEWRLKHIRGFLYYLTINKRNIKTMKKVDVYNYLNTIDSKSLKTLEHRSMCIRLFLNYLYDNKKINFSGKNVLDKIKCNAETKVLNTYTKDEIIKVIKSIDNSTSDGKRDLCIILILAQLGLRPKDVCNLKFDNINWQNNSISFIQSKSKYQNILPISQELRYALLDYLKNARIDCKYDNLFLFKNKPGSSKHLYEICKKYFILSKVNTSNKQTGPYAFRHSLGSLLLNNADSINEISDILGHKTVDETKTYAKIDIEKLRKMSLEVPTWKI